MQGRKTTPKPFQNSLSALAQVAMRETRAHGYAFFERGQVINASGVEIHGELIAGGSGQIVTYEMGTDGILAFAYPDATRAREVRPQLDRLGTTINAVWIAAQTAGRYTELANEVAGLELQLMDSKIADRVRGYLGNRREPSRDSSPVEAIEKHVEGVLRPATTGRLLEELSRSLEEEVEERRLTNRAKAILQSVHGMSEEQAHEHLRKTSRKTRRKLKDVAVDLIENVRTT